VYDLYYCDAKDETTVIARYGNEPLDYLSGLILAVNFIKNKNHQHPLALAAMFAWQFKLLRNNIDLNCAMTLLQTEEEQKRSIDESRYSRKPKLPTNRTIPNKSPRYPRPKSKGKKTSKRNGRFGDGGGI